MAEPLILERPISLDDLDLELLAASFEDRSPQDLLRWAIGCFGRELAIATSFQADGMVLLDMAWRIDPGIRVITVDSGRLRQETYDLIDQVRDRYGIAIEVYSPKRPSWRRFVGEHGPNPFYRSLELRVRCCEIRKVSPLTRALVRVRCLDLRAAAGASDDAARHPRRRARPGSRRHREAQSAGELERRRRSGTTCAPTTCPTTRSTTRDSPASAARPAPAPPRPATIRAPAAGGGRPTRRRSAASTARIDWSSLRA